MDKLYKMIFELSLAADDYIRAYQAARQIVKIDEENIKLVNFDFKFKNIICDNDNLTEEDEIEILANKHRQKITMMEKINSYYEDIKTDSLFTCKKCGLQYSVYPHIAKKNSLCGTCKKKENKMDGFTKMLNKMSEGELTEKVACVIDLLKKDIKMPTRTIMKEVDEMWEGRITVSERYVQRIRKWFRTKAERELEMNQKDVFDSGRGLHEWQINVLNMANEGGWSIQQIAESIDKTAVEVKETLTQNKHMISSEVLDEEVSDVYFDPNSKKGLVELNSHDLDPDYNPDIPPFEEDVTYGSLSGAELSKHDEPAEPANDEFWEVKIDCVTACSKTENEIDVFMSKQARNVAMSYMKWAKNREWLAYLIGNKDENGFYVYDLYLPDQRTSSVLVDKVVAEKYNELKIIGVIHSHHEMGAGDADKPSFSGHDTNFINGNHDLSLLAGRNDNGGFKIVGIARAKTPCNALMKIKANVKAMKEELSEHESALKNEFFSKVFNKKKEEEKEVNSDRSSGQYHFTDNPNYRRG